MDGLEASAEIIKLNTGIPIVAMTANIMSNDLEIYRMSGINDCVGKPFTSEELWHCLMKYFTPQSWQPVNGAKHMQGEKELRLKLISLFLKDGRNRFNTIKEAIGKGDIKLAHRQVHTLKSSAGQLGKTLLQKVAAEIEYLLKDGRNLVSPAQMTMLETELNAALEQFTVELETDSASQHDKAFQTEIKDKGVGEWLDGKSSLELIDKIEPLLEMGNPECRKFIDRLRLIHGSEELIRQMEDLEFKQARVTLAELKKGLI
jgi:HPt (histidine-containing phosphotransfer) domain-containing protein